MAAEIHLQFSLIVGECFVVPQVCAAYRDQTNVGVDRKFSWCIFCALLLGQIESIRLYRCRLLSNRFHFEVASISRFRKRMVSNIVNMIG